MSSIGYRGALVPVAAVRGGTRFSVSTICGPTAATLALHAALMAAFVTACHGNLSALVCAGAERIGQPPYECVTRGFPSGGYDGQFYYAIARAPWRQHTAGIDLPPARHLRILYPALCWLVSGGDARALLWVMPVVNLAAVCGLAALGAWLALRQGRSPWWGLLLAAACNVGMAALRDLTDPVAALAALALLAAWWTEAPVWAVGLSAVAAVLAREQNVAVVLLLLVAATWGRRWPSAAALVGALAVWGAWVATLHTLYGTWPFIPQQGNLGVPLAGMLTCWARLGTQPRTKLGMLVQGSGLTLILLYMGLAFYLIWKCRDRVLQGFLGLAVLLALTAGHAIYAAPWGYLRVLVWLPMGIWLASVRAGRRWPLWAIAPGSALTFLAVARAFAH
jgi:hypothetical protein